MISLTKLQFPSLRALPVPVVEFHGFPADFTFSLTGAHVSPRKLLFPPNPPCRVPFGNFFHGIGPTLPRFPVFRFDPCFFPQYLIFDQIINVGRHRVP